MRSVVTTCGGGSGSSDSNYICFPKGSVFLIDDKVVVDGEGDGLGIGGEGEDGSGCGPSSVGCFRTSKSFCRNLLFYEAVFESLMGHYCSQFLIFSLRFLCRTFVLEVSPN